MSSVIDVALVQCVSRLFTAETIAVICARVARIAATGIGIYARDGRLLAAQNPHRDFCGLVCREGDLAARCAATRDGAVLDHRARVESEGLDPAATTHHRCFLGFSYAVRALVLQNRAVGYAALGPYLAPGTQLGIQEIHTLAPQLTGAQLLKLRAEIAHLRDGDAAERLGALLALFDLLADCTYKLSLAGHTQYISMQENYRLLTEKNREIEELQVRLEEVDRLKSNLLSTISHELRTPLTSIIGYSGMLLGPGGGNLTAEQREFVRTVSDKGYALVEMVNRILEVATIESGRIELRREVCAVEPLVAAAVERARAAAARSDVRIERVPADGLSVVGDPPTIEKAVFHVVENAVKYSPLGGTVQVRVREVNPERDEPASPGFVIMAPTMKSVEVMVRDAGPGIPEALREKIFEPFYQGESAVTRKFGGLGLGLALVRHYIQANGGSVMVESSPGEGSAFYIRLPLHE